MTFLRCRAWVSALGGFFPWAVGHRLGGAVLFAGLFVLVATLTRLALLARAAWSVTWDLSLLGALGCGLVFDVAAAALWSLPWVVGLALLGRDAFDRRRVRALAHLALLLALYALLFGAVAEWFFWDEFAARFNFIAVDYLVYTTEVIGNIRESYPMPAILGGLAVVALVGYIVLLHTGLVDRWLYAEAPAARQRWTWAGGWVAGAALLASVVSVERLPSFANRYHRELAQDGLWSLFAAFQHNELDYAQFYPTLSDDLAFDTIRDELAEHGARFPGPGGVAGRSVAPVRDTLHLALAPRPAEPELHLNVVQLTVESLSADFLSTFNRASRLTPELERLAAQSLVFENLYATGTRTDRGMEALTLALPPTPGRSIIKRPHNADLFTLGSVFRSRGYDTAFLYGGYGYFDNMNAYFGGNGYRVVDRAAVAPEDITFANTWGACDEDLYRWTLREADGAHARGQPFHFFVMTTSNHRPYTYPEGRIDLPPKVSGRAGAVKYTDFAIGQFLRAAAAKPWFKETVFVIVADHCASVAGKTELPVQNYHIPLFVYAPGGQIAPGRVPELMSQVDYAPTLLALLNWTYASRFYGWDVRHAAGDRRALIGNYQQLGLYEPGTLDVLAPLQQHRAYACAADSFSLAARIDQQDERAEAIAYYQTASWLYRNGGYRALSSDRQLRARDSGLAGLVTPAATAALITPALHP